MPKVILITGASAGMGKDMALTFIKEGHTVYGAARRVEKMQDIVDAGGHALQMDVTNDDDMTSAVESIISTQGRIDVLINNAGFSMAGAVEEVSMDDARYQMDVNVFGPARLMQLVLPYMRSQKSGRIINISSVGGKIGFPLAAWYHASKFALEGLSDSLRAEVSQFGIDIVVIQPGAIKTDFGDALTHHLGDKYKDGAYTRLIELYQQGLEKMEKPGFASDPSVITDVVRKAITSKKPKTRYHAGKYSGTLLFLRKILPDRMMDKMGLRMFAEDA